MSFRDGKEAANMNKQEMIRYFKQECGGLFIRRGQLAELMNYKDVKSVDALLYGLERVGKGKLYFIPDVVDAIKRGSETRC